MIEVYGMLARNAKNGKYQKSRAKVRFRQTVLNRQMNHCTNYFQSIFEPWLSPFFFWLYWGHFPFTFTDMISQIRQW